MRRHRGSIALGVPAALVLALSLAGCGTEVAGGAPSATASASASASAGVPAAALGFTRYPNAVQWPAVSDYVPPGQGLQLLLPDGPCVLGIGTYQNGYRSVAANWKSGPGCTRLTLSPAPGSGDQAASGDGPPAESGGWSGGGVYGKAVVRWTDGSLIAVNGDVDRVYPNGKVTSLADLALPVPADPNSESEDQGEVTSAIRVGNRLLIGGGEMLSMVDHPLLWTSDDSGATVSRVALPVPSGPDAHTDIGALAADGSSVVAVSAGASNAFTKAPDGQLAIWSSADAGSHWTVHSVDGFPAGSEFIGVIRLKDGWLAYGSVIHYDGTPDRPLVLTSTDGESWKRSDGPGMGLGDLTAATVDASGQPVLVGSQRLPTPANTNPGYCGAVWVGDADGADWHRGALGCDAAPPTAAATLADGQVLVAGNRDLWLGRPRS